MIAEDSIYRMSLELEPRNMDPNDKKQKAAKNEIQKQLQKTQKEEFKRRTIQLEKTGDDPSKYEISNISNPRLVPGTIKPAVAGSPGVGKSVSINESTPPRKDSNPPRKDSRGESPVTVVRKESTGSPQPMLNPVRASPSVAPVKPLPPPPSKRPIEVPPDTSTSPNISTQNKENTPPTKVVRPQFSFENTSLISFFHRKPPMPQLLQLLHSNLLLQNLPRT
jgi:hypothetical protein